VNDVHPKEPSIDKWSVIRVELILPRILAIVEIPPGTYRKKVDDGLDKEGSSEANKVQSNVLSDGDQCGAWSQGDDMTVTGTRSCSA
jgi:hypothetical protein